MPKHKELVSINFHEGKYRFSLDEVLRDDEDGRTEYAFVWRGTKKSKDALMPKHAYFTWELLGKLLRKAYSEGKISDENVNEFARGLLRT